MTSPPPYQPATNPAWGTAEAKFLYEIVLGKMLQPEPRTSGDRLVPYLRAANVQWDGVRLNDVARMFANDGEIEAYSIALGDLLVCEGGEVGRAAICPAGVPCDTIIQNAVHRVRGKNGNSTRYLLYLLRHTADSGWFEVLCNKATIAHFTVEKFGELQLAYPSPATQEAIADFLDVETTRVDGLIAEKRRQLELLAEKRLALITQAVTQGLDSGAPRRDSGIAWLGEIPAHWEVVHLKRVLAEMAYGTSQSVDVEGAIGVLRMGDVNDGEVNLKKLGYLDDVDDNLFLQVGDLVFNRTNSLDQIGKVAIIRALPDFPLSFASYLVRFRASIRIKSEYLNYLLNSSYAGAFAKSEALPSIGQANLNPDRFSYLRIPLPPIEEQAEIVSYVQVETRRICNLAAVTERTIALLQERRSALISAAVTGQISIEATA